MKLRKGTLLCLIILLSTVIGLAPPIGASSVVIRVIFQTSGTGTLITPPPNVGEEFVITLRVEDTPPIIQWMVRIQWDPSVISYVKAKEGPFLSDIGETTFLMKRVNQTEGKLPEITCILLGLVTASGTGDLVYLTFRLEKEGGTKVRIYGSDLVDANYESVPQYSVVDGMINPHLIPQPTLPKADFTPPTCTRYRLSFDTNSVTVKFNASTSTGGYDLKPENYSCPITEYRWDFNGDSVFDLIGPPETAQCPEWNYTATGDVSVTLEIYAPDLTPPTHEDYKNSSRVTHTIHILPPLLGPNIDIYTNRGGLDQGINPNTGEPYPYPTGWSDAFGPQEEVAVYAKVTYNQEPLESLLVAIELIDPAGQMRVSRTAFSDVNGIANVTFRMPVVDFGAGFFGNWTIIGMVDISGKVVNDICQFRFAYLVSIQSIKAVNLPIQLGKPLNVTISLSTTSLTSKEAYITIVLYDELDVPIGMMDGDSITIDPEGTTKNYEIEILDWAFVGVGKIFVSIFTQPPDLNGTPYCPEASATFIIVYS